MPSGAHHLSIKSRPPPKVGSVLLKGEAKRKEKLKYKKSKKSKGEKQERGEWGGKPYTYTIGAFPQKFLIFVQSQTKRTSPTQ